MHSTISSGLGFQFYTNTPRGVPNCVGCHSLFTGTNSNVIAAGTLQEAQSIKVPQLRNIYKRLGFRKTTQGRTSGFGLLHDGSVQDVFDLLSKPVFRSLSTNASRKDRHVSRNVPGRERHHEQGML